jgi:hypothetical protein
MDVALFGISALINLVSSFIPTALVPPLLVTHALIFSLLFRSEE